VLAAGVRRARLREYLGLDLRRIWGPGLCRRTGATAVASGRHCACGSGEVRARSGLTAAGEASVGARSHVGVPKPWRPRADRELDGDSVDGVASAGSSAQRGRVLRVQEGAAAPF
jgi:hypothetical protein